MTRVLRSKFFGGGPVTAAVRSRQVSHMVLNVIVEAEPSSAAKGPFQCHISADGVTLTQRNKQIAIPIGVDARYAGKNQVDVTLPDCRLKMHVSKFGSYQNRLARDIAAFLSGGGDPPVKTNYSLPWYFFVVSALPLGIPILTLGGALPAMIGCGLAGGCCRIVQKEEWSTPIRLFAAGALVVLGYLGLFALLLIAAASNG